MNQPMTPTECLLFIAAALVILVAIFGAFVTRCIDARLRNLDGAPDMTDYDHSDHSKTNL